MSNSGDVRSTIDRLAAAAETVVHDDLAVLAKMHGWCEFLLEPACGQDGGPDVALANEAKALIAILESLLLGEAEDANAALEALRDGIREIGGAISSEGCTALSDVPDEQPSQTDDDDLNAALSLVFDEPAVPDSPSNPDENSTKPRTGTGGPISAPAAVESYVQQPLTIGEGEHEFVQGFVEEAREHLASIETAVLEVEKTPHDSARIDDLFRPFHTIKGMAGFLNLRDINCLAHEIETLLDQGRKGQRAITSDMIDLVFEVVDILKLQIDSIAAYMSEPNGDPVNQPPVAGMIEKLRRIAAGGGTEAAGPPAARDPNSAQTPRPEASAGPVPSSPTAGADSLPPNAEQHAAPTNTIAPSPSANATSSAGGQSKAPAGDSSVRIETAKLDALVDMVGELVIAQTLVAAHPNVGSDPKLSKDIGQVAKIVRDVQETAMSMRMIPIGPTFQRMARLVRDVSRKAGKKVELTIAGEDTELDKNVIQQIGDPLVHMVRNAVDHGVESPADRIAHGKDEVGKVHLGAFHHGGNIVIEIRDDGKGLDAEKLIAKGIEKGIVRPGEDLTDEQAYALIFAPGFSTAEKVTDISGRGVGMDVVRRNLEQLRGRVEITSEKGCGSTFAIRLPLTLAIIDGMVLSVGPERFIIPTIAIEQAMRPVPEQISTVQQRGELINVRGRLIPLIQLGELFGLTGRVDPCKAMVVVAHCEGRQIGLVVDGLIGQQQVVIKSLGQRFEGLRGVSGAAILGDGHVGLILETSGIAVAHNHWRPLAGALTSGDADTSATSEQPAIDTLATTAAS